MKDGKSQADFPIFQGGNALKNKKITEIGFGSNVSHVDAI